LVLLLIATVFTGCRAEQIGEVDPAQIEAVVREYYQAFNDYDLSRIEAVFTDEAWQGEGSGLSAWLCTAESLGFKSEFVSIASIRNDGSTTLATVEVNSDLGMGKDFVRLVRERGGWKLVEVLTKKVGQASPTEETPSGSSCCPQ
jgi:hypothetical protein